MRAQSSIDTDVPSSENGGEALGRPVDLKHPASRGSYRMPETPPDEAERPVSLKFRLFEPAGVGALPSALPPRARSR